MIFFRSAACVGDAEGPIGLDNLQFLISKTVASWEELSEKPGKEPSEDAAEETAHDRWLFNATVRELLRPITSRLLCDRPTEVRRRLSILDISVPCGYHVHRLDRQSMVIPEV